MSLHCQGWVIPAVVIKQFAHDGLQVLEKSWVGKRGLQQCMEEPGHKEPFQQQFGVTWMHIRGVFELLVNQGSPAEPCLQDLVGMSVIAAALAQLGLSSLSSSISPQQAFPCPSAGCTLTAVMAVTETCLCS